MLSAHDHAIHVLQRVHARARACFHHKHVRGCAHGCVCSYVHECASRPREYVHMYGHDCAYAHGDAYECVYLQSSYYSIRCLRSQMPILNALMYRLKNSVSILRPSRE